GHGNQWWIGAAAIAAILGHVFTIWLGFRGGKGVATGAGVFLVLSPVSVLLLIPVFVAVVFIWRYVSLGSIVATAAIPVWIFISEVLILRRQPETVALETTAVICCVVIIASHHQNIRRLFGGTENRI